MIVAVMGAVFNILFAFLLSCILWFFGYDVRASQLTTEIGYVADEVERWNPLIEEGETVPGPAKLAGFKPGDKILKVDDSSVEDFMDVQNHIVTGKRKTEEGHRKVTLLIEREGKEISCAWLKQERRNELLLQIWPRGAIESKNNGSGCMYVCMYV